MKQLIVELVGGPFDGEECRVPLIGFEWRPGSVLHVRGEVYQLSSVPNVPLAHHIGAAADLPNHA